MNSLIRSLAVSAAVLCAALPVHAAQAPENAQEAAPHDLTGYWVALVTEDWRFRMIIAPAGDHEGITLTPMGQQIADAWNPDADIAAGAACKAYGAGGLMRMPTRLHITWASENVLSIETDAGEQTRLLKFGPARDEVGAGSLQGVSDASWDLERQGRAGPVVNGTLQVVTTDMQSGYVRRNGIPYSDQATLTEYFERLVLPNGDEYLVVISELEDPLYLAQPVLTSTSFKREADDAGWSPSECIAKNP